VTDWIHRTMIVPAAFQPLAASLTAGIAGSSGAGMFQAAAGASVEGPPTHYSSSGLIDRQFASLLPLDIIQADGSLLRIEQGQPEAIAAAATAAGSPVPLPAIQALLAAVIVTGAYGWESTYEAAGLHQLAAGGLTGRPVGDVVADLWPH
jgi:hypothetical protein